MYGGGNKGLHYMLSKGQEEISPRTNLYFLFRICHSDPSFKRSAQPREVPNSGIEGAFFSCPVCLSYSYSGLFRSRVRYLVLHL